MSLVSCARFLGWLCLAQVWSSLFGVSSSAGLLDCGVFFLRLVGGLFELLQKKYISMNKELNIQMNKILGNEKKMLTCSGFY